MRWRTIPLPLIADSNILGTKLPSLNFAQLDVVSLQEFIHFFQSEIDRWATSLKIKRTVEMGCHKDAHVIHPQRISVIHWEVDQRLWVRRVANADIDKHFERLIKSNAVWTWAWSRGRTRIIRLSLRYLQEIRYFTKVPADISIAAHRYLSRYRYWNKMRYIHVYKMYPTYIFTGT